MAPCHGEIQDRIEAATSMISRSSTAATSSSFLDPPIHFKNAMIPIFGEEFFWPKNAVR